MKQTKPPEEWEKELLDLKCVNYNMYLGVDGGELTVSFDEGVKELKDFIRSLLAKQTKQRTKNWINDYALNALNMDTPLSQMYPCECKREEMVKQIKVWCDKNKFYCDDIDYDGGDAVDLDDLIEFLEKQKNETN